MAIRVKIVELFEDGKRVVVFQIPSRPVGQILKFEGTALMRIGDSLRFMSDLEKEQLVQKEGIGRHTLYSLHKSINPQANIFIQFVNRLSK